MPGTSHGMGGKFACDFLVAWFDKICYPKDRIPCCRVALASILHKNGGDADGQEERRQEHV